MQNLTDHLRASGINVFHDFVPLELVRKVLRLINGEGFRNAKDISTLEKEWRWFPWLEQRDEIQALAKTMTAIPPDDTQIVLGLPHIGWMSPITPHIDTCERWELKEIVGVSLSPQTTLNGALWVWDKDHVAHQIETNPGDIVVLKPDVKHNPGYNISGDIRYAVYFRWVKGGWMR